MIVEAIKRRIHKLTIYLYKLVSKLLPRNKPLPISFWLGIRALFFLTPPDKNPLCISRGVHRITGADLELGAQAFLTSEDILGAWSLDAETITFLWDELLEQKPDVIIECGSGVSTMILAAYASRLHAGQNTQVQIISLEQDESGTDSIRRRLRLHNLDRYVKVLYAPLDKQGSYTLTSEAILEATGGRLADWVIIDGPCGPPGCRVHTLPLLAPYCKNRASWYLDDALRDGEVNALKSWQSTEGLGVHGIYALGKGLAVGLLNV